MKHLFPGLLVRALVVATAACASTLLVAGPASAHPFGDPQQLEISHSDGRFGVVWKAADDDLTSLALRLDVLGGPRATVFRDGAETPSYIDEADAEKLAESPLLEQYLLARIELKLGDDACTGALEDATDLASSGARLTYTCPGQVDATTLTVRSRTLTDLHAAYKTMATGPGDATHVFTADADTHDFGLGETTGPTVAESGIELLTWAGVGGVALLVGGAVTVRARKRRAA